MLPIVGIPPTIADGMKAYREVFCQDAGFEHVSHYVTGLLLCPNKTLQGIYAQRVFADATPVSRRAMHEALFEAGWEREELMRLHREVVADRYRGQGRSVIGLDWTLAHHERSEHIYGAKRAYDYVDRRMSCYQTVVTAAVCNRERVDGVAIEVQHPNYEAEEWAYLQMTARDSYDQMEQVQERLLELLSYQVNRLAYRKRTEMVVEIVRQLETEGHFPEAHYAFDNGVLSRPLTELIEQHHKHWVSEIECSRHILWDGQWQRVDGVAQQLRLEHPDSFRPVEVRCRNRQVKEYWVFSKCVRLKKYGRKRLVMVHEQEDLKDAPRFLLTDARHWEASRVIQTWSYRWPIEVFHEFGKQLVGLESAQVRKEEAVKRHFCLSCVAQSLLQNSSVAGGKSDRFSFARGEQSVGQKLYGLTREALQQLLALAQNLFALGRSAEHVLEVLMPA
jgi:hypothetical protein